MTNLNLKQTILHDTHVASKAKMVDFGGWHMPIQYSSQLEEHFAVRQNIGLFDVSHMCIVDLIGKDTKDFLQKLIANDINKLTTSGKALYSCMLNEQGGVIDDLIAYYFNDEFYRLVINAGCAEKDLIWINKIAKDFDININKREDLAMIAVQGPKSLELFDDNIKNLKPFTAFLDEENQTVIARTGYTGEDGVEIMLPNSKAIQTWNNLISKGAIPCGLGARDTLRLEAGMNLYGQDMDEETNPYDAGLGWTISLQDKRDFIGKQSLLDLPRKYKFLGLVLESGGILRAHQQVNFRNQKGEVTSGGYSPTMQKSIAMAKLPLDVNLNDEVLVKIRDKELSAKVVKLPFVRNGKIL